MDRDIRSCPARLRARLAAPWEAGRARVRAERGSMLIEVMVGAVILAIAATAIFGGLDGAQDAGARNKARSVQAALAQQDIERMRAIPITALSNYRETRPVSVAGVDYTVVSRTDWVRDATGVVGCTSDQQAAQYLKLSSTVTSPATTDSPVKETSLLTPAAGALSTTAGTATVRLTDRDGLPLVGISVGMSGPGSFTERTDEQGCAIFGYLPAGSYTAQVSGYVTPASTLPAQEDVVVYTAKSTLANMQVDRPAGLRATFVAPASNTFAPASAMVWDSITVKNSNLPGVRKEFPRPGGSGATVDADSLFPFADGVGVYAGSCAANDPSTYQANYFQPGGRGYTELDPGDALRPVDVEMPTLRVTVYRSNTTTNFRSSILRFTPLDSGCSTGFVTSFTFPSATRPKVYDVAVPFGRYSVCASTRSTTSSSSARRVTSTQDLRTPVPPTANRQITMTTGSSTGDC